ncbi:glucosamine--fructose-6-phosphate aminotransferase [Brucella endophytica]|uniref:Glucosamine--fructose-6-phosphate aminotransferase n=1 Tax=Brucella endophytica TaxID=1963359 RepID=A0A916SDF5_9HYPH|nr:SIS domain-containing protein [Brucella endophytica]GGA93941.1 glucosamine--fructose-6-phosphate aminotransferase [Brucella endophytica]
MAATTNMRREIEEIPSAVARLLDASASQLKAAGKALADKDPVFVATIARGSSDHASLFLKYAIELYAGKAVASLGPSLASIYERPIDLRQAATLTISQSGGSPDIIDMCASARRQGALTLGLTNTPNSPIWQQAEIPIDLAAGPELAVAATKSFVNSIVAGLAVLAEWIDDNDLKSAVRLLPDQLRAALAVDWSAMLPSLEDATSLYILGRGPGLAIASEIALKFKETSNLHAEAYSVAEVMHGPLALVAPGFPVLVLAGRDASEAATLSLADDFAGRGANVFVTSKKTTSAQSLSFAETGHALTDALALIVPFYVFCEQLSRRRGLNPDQPVALKKVTQTR